MEASKRQAARITFNSPVILGFVFICVVVQVVSTLTVGASTQMFFTSYPSSLADPLTYLRLVTHAFGHASWDHLFGNMAYILLLGPLLEEKYGSGRLAAIMLASALASSIANIVFLHAGVVGASGIVFTFILLSSVTGLRDGEIPLTFILVAVLYFGQQVYGALFVRDNVSYLGHIAGGLVGTVVGFLLPPKPPTNTGYGLE